MSTEDNDEAELYPTEAAQGVKGAEHAHGDSSDWSRSTERADRNLSVKKGYDYAAGAHVGEVDGDPVKRKVAKHPGLGASYGEAANLIDRKPGQTSGLAEAYGSTPAGTAEDADTPSDV